MERRGSNGGFYDQCACIPGFMELSVVIASAGGLLHHRNHFWLLELDVSGADYRSFKFGTLFQSLER